MQAILKELQASYPAALAQLQDFIRLETISTMPEKAAEMQKCADFLAAVLTESGLENVEILPTGGHPAVYADWLHAPAAPTLLIYGHYDVQPVDPLELWDAAPFDPQVVDNRLVARGASDNKGQIYMHIRAVRAWLTVKKRLPVNVRFLIEGEEEIASVNLPALVSREAERLQADLLVVSDSNMIAPEQPAITYGLRGLTYLEVNLTGPNRDLHSGIFGGTVLNPLQEAARLISLLHDAEGRVAIPGFYDEVVPLEAAERKQLARQPFSAEEYSRDLGVAALWGDPEYTPLERAGARPTCEINGILGGFTGEGAKTVLPARAMFKVSFRLVPHQDPDRIVELAEAFLREQVAVGVQLEVNRFAGGRPVLTPWRSPAIQAASRALERAFGRPPQLVREGGSIPIVADIQHQLGVTPLLIGFGLPDSRIHSPNENFNLDVFKQGSESLVYLLEELAAVTA